MNETTSWAVGGVVFLLGMFAIYTFYEPTADSSVAAVQTSQADKALAYGVLKEAETFINSTKGQEFTKGIVNDGATLDDGHRLTLTLRLPPGVQIDTRGDALKQVTKEIQTMGCGIDPLVEAIKIGGVIRYVFKSSAGAELYSVVISQRICSKLH